MMVTQTYRIVVYLVEASADDNGVTMVDTATATYVTEATDPGAR